MSEDTARALSGREIERIRDRVRKYRAVPSDALRLLDDRDVLVERIATLEEALAPFVIFALMETHPTWPDETENLIGGEFCLRMKDYRAAVLALDRVPSEIADQGLDGIATWLERGTA